MCLKKSFFLVSLSLIQHSTHIHRETHTEKKRKEIGRQTHVSRNIEYSYYCTCMKHKFSTRAKKSFRFVSTKRQNVSSKIYTTSIKACTKMHTTKGARSFPETSHLLTTDSSCALCVCALLKVDRRLSIIDVAVELFSKEDVSLVLVSSFLFSKTQT